MVQAMIHISEKANQVLNIVKARHSLKDKSEAIEFVVMEYGIDLLEPELRPEFVKKIQRTDRKQGIGFKSIEELRKRYE